MAAARADRRTLRPRDAKDLAELLQSREGALAPVAGGSKRFIGPPIEADVLDLAALSGIDVYEPEELVLTASAATPLAEIEAQLARHGQRLAFEPPDFGPLFGSDPPASGQTIGGVLAANLAGSRRIAGGAARDHFLGFEAVSGDGVAFKAGGRVVKNVTGYDLPKLLAGSWGTLAVLTRVTVRVAPIAETEQTLLLPMQDPASAVACLARALGTPHEVSAAAFVPGQGAALRVEGFAESVAARIKGLLAALGHPEMEFWGDVQSRAFWARVGAAADLAEARCVVRISVAPTAAPTVLARIAPERYLLDWGGGLIWAAFDAVDIERVRAALPEGHATLWKAPSALRASAQVFPPLIGAAAELAARLKTAFDPEGRLSPGKMGYPTGRQQV